jgi:hypothetical protein
VCQLVVVHRPGAQTQRRHVVVRPIHNARARTLPCAGALSEDVQPGDDYLVKMWLHLGDVCRLISH